MNSFLSAIIFISFLLSSSAKGQVNSSEKGRGNLSTNQFYFGLKTGMNVPIIGHFLRSKRLFIAVTGFNNGLYAGYVINKNFGVQLEGLFSINNLQVRVNGKSRKIFFKNSCIYINVPVLFQYVFPKRIYLEGGVQFGFLISDNFKAEINPSIDISEICKYFINIHEYFKRFHLGTVGSIGYRLDKNLNINLRYIYDLNDRARYDVLIKKDFVKLLKNSILQLNVNYTI